MTMFKYIIIFIISIQFSQLNAAQQNGIMHIFEAEIDYFEDMESNTALANELKQYEIRYLILRLPKLLSIVSSGGRLMGGDLTHTGDRPIIKIAVMVLGQTDEDLQAQLTEELNREVALLAKEHLEDKVICENEQNLLATETRKILDDKPEQSIELLHPLFKNNIKLIDYRTLIKNFNTEAAGLNNIDYKFCQTIRKHPRFDFGALIFRYGITLDSVNNFGTKQGELEITAFKDEERWKIAGIKFFWFTAK